MNYENELEKMQESAGEVFKPTAGIHNVEILAEPEETEYVDGDKVTPQIKLSVKVSGVDKMWYISKGTTMKSLYGQLVALGKFKGNKLQGEKITLSVAPTTNREGKNVNSYQIIEAIQILPQLTKPKVEAVN